MAAAALERAPAPVDFDETKDMGMFVAGRPPETEIYGRSLSTPYRLGVFVVRNTIQAAMLSPEASQAKAEFYTSVEEGFGTDMELGGGLEVRDFDARAVIDERVMSKDLKTSVSDMTYAGLICAEEKARKETAKNDRRFLPQLIRSKWDHENALIVDRMAKGETDYNTRIVISPFPEEAAAESGEAYWRNIGYVPHLKRGFVQLYHVSEEGKQILAGSLSFDGSNKERLRELFRQRGVEIPHAETTDNWLKYAVTDNLNEDQARALALEIANEAGTPNYKKTRNTVDVTHKYRAIIDRVFNESYIHACESLARGSQTEGVQKLILQLANKSEHFNQRYQNTLRSMKANKHQFADADMIILHELLVYSTIEMMRAFHIEAITRASKVSSMYSSQILDAIYSEALRFKDPEALQSALSKFAAKGAINNRVYSACGLSISVGESDISGFPQSVFGGVGYDEDNYGKLTFTCENGHHNRRSPGKLLAACQRQGCKAKVTC